MPMTKRRMSITASAAALALLSPWQASADTLTEALAKAYRTNPTLTGARAAQRANDENVPIERSAGLPNVNAGGSYTENLRGSGVSIDRFSRVVNGGVNLTVPIYQGGAVAN